MTYEELKREIQKIGTVQFDILEDEKELLLVAVNGLIIAKINKCNAFDLNLMDGRVDGIGYTERKLLLNNLIRLAETSLEERV